MKYKQLLQFSTATVSDALDALGISGEFLAIGPLEPGVKLVGPAYTIKYQAYAEKPVEFKGAADYIDTVPEGFVVVIDNDGRADCTVWGDILTQVAIKRNLSGALVYGAARDVAFVREAKFPLFAKHIYMRSGKNRVFKSAEQCVLKLGNVDVCPGDILFGDDNGVVVVPPELLEDVLEKAKAIQNTERKIVEAIGAGVSLAEARAQFRYDIPWQVSGESKV